LCCIGDIGRGGAVPPPAHSRRPAERASLAFLQTSRDLHPARLALLPRRALPPRPWAPGNEQDPALPLPGQRHGFKSRFMPVVAAPMTVSCRCCSSGCRRSQPIIRACRMSAAGRQVPGGQPVHENWELRGVTAKPSGWSGWPPVCFRGMNSLVRPPPVCFRGAWGAPRTTRRMLREWRSPGEHCVWAGSNWALLSAGSLAHRTSRRVPGGRVQWPLSETAGHSQLARGSSRRARISLLRTTSPSAGPRQMGPEE
jgi:hypothetical protein